MLAIKNMSEWVKHIPLEGLNLPEDDSYISFGLVSELATENGQFQNPESLTHFLVTDMFKGKFEAPRTGLVPAIYAADHSRIRTPMLVPQISVDATLLSRSEHAHFIVFGWGNGSREAVLFALHALNALPISLPLSINDKILQDAYEELSTCPFFRYSEPSQEYLLNINVRKHVLKDWFEERGMTAPWTSSNGDNMEIIETASEDEANLPVSDNLSKKPGRPPSKLWDFIQEQGSKIRNEKPEMLNKCLAGRVQDIARSEFPDAQIPALATIQKHLSRNGLSRYSQRKR